MFTPWNACPACPARPVAPEDGTGVGSGNPTGVESFLFVSRSLPSSGFRPRNSEMHHTLCAMLQALCTLPSAPCFPFYWGPAIL